VQDDIAKRMKAGVIYSGAELAQRLKAVEEFVKTLAARIDVPVDFPDVVMQRLENVEALVFELGVRIERLKSITDVNTNNIEDVSNRIEPVGLVASRVKALELASSATLHMSGTGSMHSKPEDVVIRAHAYRRFLEGVDP
jgi:hypothetical protein